MNKNLKFQNKQLKGLLTSENESEKLKLREDAVVIAIQIQFEGAIMLFNGKVMFLLPIVLK